MPKKRITPEQVRALLTDPAYLAMRREKDARIQANLARLAAASQPLLDDLNEAGFFVTSVWDLVNTASPYPRALPILLAHLQRDYPAEVLDGIARAMAVPASKFAWPTLLRLFRAQFDQNPSGPKHGLAVALAAIADDELMPDLIELFRQPRHGECRIFFVKPLKRSKLASARLALEAGRQDPQLVKEIEWLLDRPKRRRRTGGRKPDASQDHDQPS